MKNASVCLASICLALPVLLCACQGEPKSADRDAKSGPEVDAPDRMAWWREARFGMFLHWGLYSVPAGEWNGNTGHAEWILTTAQIPVERYEQFVPQFDPVGFDADAWAKMAADAGMKYVVITSKHHDGFALYDSAASDYDVMATPFGRDILRELADAVRRHGMVMCWYHSIMDWHHPDYLPRREWESRPAQGADFERYRKYLHAQVTELLTNYGPIGVMWFDGEWEPTWTNEFGKELYALCRSLQPDVIVNNRVSTGRAGMQGMTKGAEFPGDFGTPEQEIPPQGLPGVDWETCMTMNDHWGFNAKDQNWKSNEDLIRKLCDIASKGGNFLLNVGPTAQGEFPQGSVDRLAAIGAWMRVNGEAIHGTQASPFDGLDFGRCTLRSAATTTLYLHVFDWPIDGVLELEGLGNRVKGARLLADPARSVTAESRDGRVEFRVGVSAPDPIASVLAVEIEGAPIVFKAPRIEAPLPRFLDRTQVTLSADSPRVEVRYTLDGSEPSSASALAATPLDVRQSCTLRARCFFEGRAVGAESSLELRRVSARGALTLPPKSAGLLRERFAGSFEKLPEFSALQASDSSDVAAIGLPEGPREERVAYVFRGAFRVGADDVYRFGLSSDDGSRLWVDGALLVDNDGLHSAQELFGSEALAAGWHTLRVEWFNATGGAELSLKIHDSAGAPVATSPADFGH